MKEFESLGSEIFWSVYLAEDPSDWKQYLVKELMTKNQDERVEKLILSEPDQLAKLSKYKHPNLQKLLT